MQTVEERQGLMICCPEEIAFHRGYIEREQLFTLANVLGKTIYSDYLLRLLEEREPVEAASHP